jgi:hypothetical protein
MIGMGWPVDTFACRRVRSHDVSLESGSIGKHMLASLARAGHGANFRTRPKNT